MATRHGGDRAHERLTSAGLPPEQVTQMLAKAEAIARKYQREDLAVCLARLARRQGEAWGEQSNGNEVWAICRRGDVVTVMFRRSTQPRTPGAFGVRRVLG